MCSKSKAFKLNGGKFYLEKGLTIILYLRYILVKKIFKRKTGTIFHMNIFHLINYFTGLHNRIRTNLCSWAEIILFQNERNSYILSICSTIFNTGIVIRGVHFYRSMQKVLSFVCEYCRTCVWIVAYAYKSAEIWVLFLKNADITSFSHIQLLFQTVFEKNLRQHHKSTCGTRTAWQQPLKCGHTWL